MTTRCLDPRRESGRACGHPEELPCALFDGDAWPRSTRNVLTETDQQHMRAAEGWLELGNWQEANEALEEVEAAHRALAPVLALRCRIYAAAGHWETALLIGARLADSSFADAELLLALAASACQLDDVSRARELATRAVNLNQTPEFKLRILDDERLRPLLG